MVNLKQTSLTNLYSIKNESLFHFDNNVILTKVDINTFAVNNIFPVRVPVFSFFLIEEGCIEIELDYNRHIVERKCFLIVLPEHLIQSIKFSQDFKGLLVIVNQGYFSSIEKSNFRLYQPVFLNIRKYPGLLLNENEYSVIFSCLNRIMQKMILQNHHLKEALIETLLIEFLLEIDNVLINNKYNLNFQKSSRREELIYNFFQLLNENGKIEHKVVFYADKLHITTQYLAFILKETTGTATHEWIVKALIIEAKILLKHSHENIQQISELLNFCDPSAFGKFFKTHTGITPFQFRKTGVQNE